MNIMLCTLSLYCCKLNNIAVYFSICFFKTKIVAIVAIGAFHKIAEYIC